MADAVVSLVVERFAEFLSNEVASLRGVNSEVQSLKDDLATTIGVIKDAEDKQVDNEAITLRLSEIIGIVYDCEDFLDKFMIEFHDESSNMALVNEGETSERRHQLFTSIEKYFCMVTEAPKEMFELHGAGTAIKELKARLNDVSSRGKEFALEDVYNKREGGSKALHEFMKRRRTISFEDVVGHEEDTKTLLGKLLDNKTGLFAISIWGATGFGRTTFARKLYHNDQLKHKFQNHAWVSVSQDYNIEDGSKQKLMSKLKKMSEGDLKKYLQECLKGSSYMIVIDDVWRTDDWKGLIEAFPDNKCGSRIIMTTCDTEVAACADYVHKLELLSEDESWELFCAKTSGKATETKEMEELGSEMVQKCGGLPLAILLLGGLLFEKSAQEWCLMHNNICQPLNRGLDHVKYLFHLSFNDLSYQLKLCFLYLGHFPKDSEIPTKRLIRLWVAEGFIPRNEEIMEDVAYFYLDELVKRNLIQIDKTRRGRIIACRVHDVLRDLAIQKAQELKLFQLYDVNNRSSCSLGTRRQAVHSGMESYLQLQQSKVLRSLFFFNIYRAEASEDLGTVISTFRLLRVLDLSYLSMKTIPQEVGELIHLKYLELRETGIQVVPPFILKLVSLQTLNLIGTSMKPSLPPDISKLQELRHLFGIFSGNFRIDNLVNLQTLRYIPGKTWIKTNPEGLVNLRELHISLGHEEVNNFTFDSVAKLKSLQILRVHMAGRTIPSLRPLSACKNLVDKLKNDPMPTLEKLPNLTVLYLSSDSYDGKKMVCGKKGFPRLEILVLFERHLAELQVAEGAMPKLKSFIKSREVPNSRIPERLRHENLALINRIYCLTDMIYRELTNYELLYLSACYYGITHMVVIVLGLRFLLICDLFAGSSV
ncbi:disease resistance protein RPP13-like [Pistacia vera]|uniref:disease resistance protein RPP13-like n=1 Tax=Pistacia vera TaxID=55513 RepID=UPI001262C627|nr:disease resistance protein RPP13-like [Pistacia vera]